MPRLTAESSELRPKLTDLGLGVALAGEGRTAAVQSGKPNNDDPTLT